MIALTAVQNRTQRGILPSDDVWRCTLIEPTDDSAPANKTDGLVDKAIGLGRYGRDLRIAAGGGEGADQRDQNRPGGRGDQKRLHGLLPGVGHH